VDGRLEYSTRTPAVPPIQPEEEDGAAGGSAQYARHCSVETAASRIQERKAKPPQGIVIVDDEKIFPQADDLKQWGYIGDTDPPLPVKKSGKPYLFFCVATVACFTKKVSHYRAF